MISSSDRKQAVVLIDEAHAAGVRKWRACEELEISVRRINDGRVTDTMMVVSPVCKCQRTN